MQLRQYLAASLARGLNLLMTTAFISLSHCTIFFVCFILPY